LDNAHQQVSLARSLLRCVYRCRHHYALHNRRKRLPRGRAWCDRKNLVSRSSVPYGYSRRFKERYLHAKEQVSQGRLGRVVSVHARA
jgi:hypothetical protein